MSDKKCIWYISKYIAPAYAAKNQARGFFILKSWFEQGHNSILITSDSSHQTNAPNFSGSRMFEVVDGVEVHWLKTLKYKKTASIGRIISWFDFEWQLFKMPKGNLLRPDAIIVSSLSLLTILNGLWLRKKYGCKLVFEVRDIWPMVLVETGNFSRFNPFVLFLSWLEKLGYKKADKVVGTMPNLSEHVRNVTNTDISAACVPQGVDFDLVKFTEPLSSDYINKYIPKNKFIVCHAGSIGVDNALESLFLCARELKDNENIHFLIVGEGDLKEKFEKLTDDLSNVTFAPRVEKKQVQNILKLADVVYFSVNKSKLWSYGQSLNKVVDYMLSGKPIVASYTGYPSMVNESGCGVYVPAEDVKALKHEIEIMENMPKEQRETMGAKGKTWVMKHRQFDTLANDYLNIIFDYK